MLLDIVVYNGITLFQILVFQNYGGSKGFYHINPSFVPFAFVKFGGRLTEYRFASIWFLA
jgi:hypothetical protein